MHILYVVCVYGQNVVVSHIQENVKTLTFSVVSIPCLKKNQNALRPSEHPPVKGEKRSKRLGGIKGCKYKTSLWHLNRFLDGNNIGSTV